MTLSETVRARVLDRAPFRGHLEHFLVSEGNVTVRCDLSEAERLGLAVSQVEVVEESLRLLSTEDLARRADRLCEKVTYLLEPLRTVEVDRRAQAALLRSKCPRERHGLLTYYELIATADHHTTFRRFAYNVEQRKRGLVNFLVTTDQLERLVEDLTSPHDGVVN